MSDDRRVEPVVAGNGIGSTVAAWRTTTGQPVEVRTHGPGGGWGPRHTVGGRNARDPAVAVAPDGTAVVLVQAYDRNRRAAITAYTSRDDFHTAVVVSPGDAGARRPQVAVDARGRATAIWVRDVGARSGVVQAAVQQSGGRWGAPVTISDEGHIEGTSLAVAPDGTAIAAWEVGSGGRKRIVGALRREDGRWTAADALSEPSVYSTDPAVAAQNGGRAAALWLQDRSGGVAETRAIVATDGEWGTPVTVDTGDALPLEVARPGRAWLGPAAVIAPDGRLTAAWPLTWDGVTRVRTSSLEGSAWRTPETISGAADQAAGVTMALGPGGRPVVGWEEIDHGLLRARVAFVDALERCVDLNAPTGETAGVDLAGGTRPVAVFVDLNRSRIVAVDLP